MLATLRPRIAIALRIFTVVLVISILSRLTFLAMFKIEAAKANFYSVLLSLLVGLRFDLSAFSMVFLLPIVLLFLPIELKGFRKMVWLLVLLLHFAWMAIALGDLIFYSISHRRAAAEFGAVFASWRDFWSFVKGSAIYIVLGIPVGILPFYFLYRRQIAKELEPISLVQSLVTIAVLILVGIIGIRGGLQGRPLNATHAFVVGDYFLGNVALNPVFATIKMAYSDSSVTINRTYATLAKSELRELLATKNDKFPEDNFVFYRSSSPTQQKHIPKNVVIFIMESWSAADLGWFGNPLKATPNFDRLADKGVSFTQAYAFGSRSITAIPTIASSIAALFGKPYTTSTYANNKQRGIGTIFAEKGYATYFITGYKAGAQGFSTYMRVAGFEKIITRENLGLGPEKSDGVWGTYDHYTFARAHEIFTAERQPFIAIVPSLQPHHPYRLPTDYAERDFYREIPRVAHFNALRYSDYALGEFLRLAEKSPYFKDTLFVITADHTYTQNGVMAKFHIPLVFYAPGFLKPERRHNLASQLDILPTVIEILGLQTTHAAMGKSLWQKNSPEWALIDMDSNVGCLMKPWGIVVNKDSPVAAYNFITDPDFSHNLLPSHHTILDSRISQCYSLLYAINESIRENRIAP